MGTWGHGDWGLGDKGLDKDIYSGTWIGTGGERLNTINETNVNKKHIIINTQNPPEIIHNMSRLFMLHTLSLHLS